MMHNVVQVDALNQINFSVKKLRWQASNKNKEKGG